MKQKEERNKIKQKKEKNGMVLNLFIILIYITFILFSFLFKMKVGIEIGNYFSSFLLYMFKILPCAFILIGLFEVWVPRERVEKHLGYSGGIQGYVWAIILAGTIAGGLMVALPVSSVLYHKGARLGIIFTFLSASAIVRIPMTLFEATFLGYEFTIIRWLVSIPLIIISSMFLEKYAKKQHLTIK